MPSRRALLAGLALSVAASALPAAGHPLDEAPNAVVAQVEGEVLRFRAELVEAIKAKDAARLEGMYASNYTHTHGSGRVDGRERRLVSLLKGEPVIETAPVNEIAVRVYGPDTAIVSGASPILDAKEGRAFDYRWVQVFVRMDGQWRIAASQATKIAGTS